jgi:hypothetical protein
MGYERFFAELFSCPFLVVQAVLAAPVGWLDRLSTPPAPSDGAMSPESTSEILCFNLSPVVRLFQNAAIMRWWRVSGKKLSVILRMDGAPAQCLWHGTIRAIAAALRCAVGFSLDSALTTQAPDQR